MFWDPSGLIWKDNNHREEEKKRYGENSIIYGALSDLFENWKVFEEFRSDIEELADYIRQQVFIRSVGELYVDYGAGVAEIEAGVEFVRTQLPDIDINRTELIISALDPIAAYCINLARMDADDITQERFGAAWSTDDTMANAFRHTLWNALSVQYIGTDRKSVV